MKNSHIKENASDQTRFSSILTPPPPPPSIPPPSPTISPIVLMSLNSSSSLVHDQHLLKANKRNSTNGKKKSSSFVAECFSTHLVVPDHDHLRNDALENEKDFNEFYYCSSPNFAPIHQSNQKDSLANEVPSYEVSQNKHELNVIERTAEIGLNSFSTSTSQSNIPKRKKTSRNNPKGSINKRITRNRRENSDNQNNNHIRNKRRSNEKALMKSSVENNKKKCNDISAGRDSMVSLSSSRTLGPFNEESSLLTLPSTSSTLMLSIPSLRESNMKTHHQNAHLKLTSASNESKDSNSMNYEYVHRGLIHKKPDNLNSTFLKDIMIQKTNNVDSSVLYHALEFDALSLKRCMLTSIQELKTMTQDLNCALHLGSNQVDLFNNHPAAISDRLKQDNSDSNLSIREIIKEKIDQVKVDLEKRLNKIHLDLKTEINSIQEQMSKQIEISMQGLIETKKEDSKRNNEKQDFILKKLQQIENAMNRMNDSSMATYQNENKFVNDIQNDPLVTLSPPIELVGTFSSTYHPQQKSDILGHEHDSDQDFSIFEHIQGRNNSIHLEDSCDVFQQDLSF